MAEKIVVINGARAGYRRAGLSLAVGRNELFAADVSAAQLEMLKADPRLALVEAGEAAIAPGSLEPGGVSGDLATGYLGGVVDQDGTVRDLASMKVDELKVLAKELAIEGYAGMKKVDLVAAILATEIQYDATAADGQPSVAGAQAGE